MLDYETLIEAATRKLGSTDPSALAFGPIGESFFGTLTPAPPQGMRAGPVRAAESYESREMISAQCAYPHKSVRLSR